jgi:predicted enzyme related to lactoylglutathione lyase
MTTAEPGTPNWVDLGSPDLEASRKFYSQLFGWTPNVSPDPQYGGYTIFSKDSKTVAGAGALSGESQIPAWSIYLATGDANVVAARVEQNGGKIVAPPMDVGQEGRMAVFTDPGGASFSVWQAGSMPGAEMVNAPGALTWNELTSRDPDRAKAFYRAVFGWDARENPDSGVKYTIFMLHDQPIAGMMPMSSEAASKDLPPLWMVYFAVEDADATAATAKKLGGQVMVPAADKPQGRSVVINDPQGAVFSVIKPI